jgi:Glycosyltransferase family 87
MAIGVIFLLLLAYTQRERVLKGQNDFVAFYTGAKLVGTPALYSRTANIATIKGILGFALDGTTFIRPPFYAAILKPLAAFSYPVAYGIFFLGTLSSALWFVIRFSKECAELPFFAALGIPVLTPLCNGQDTPFLLAALGASILLLRRNRDFWAGVVFSLCAIKFHLFLFVPIFLLLKKQWRVLAGGICGTVLLTVLGLLVAGRDSLMQWIGVMRDPWIMPNPENLPNIHGLILALHGDARWELLLVGMVGAMFLWMTQQTDNWEFLLAVSLVCGLLTSFHTGLADDILLFPVFVLVLGSSANVLLRSLSALVLMPIPYMFGFAGAPYSAVLPLLLMLWLTAAALALQKKSISSTVAAT